MGSGYLECYHAQCLFTLYKFASRQTSSLQTHGLRAHHCARAGPGLLGALFILVVALEVLGSSGENSSESCSHER